MFKIGQTVKFIDQPSTGWQDLAGKVGKVTDVIPNYAGSAQDYTSVYSDSWGPNIGFNGVGTITTPDTNLVAVSGLPWKWLAGIGAALVLIIVIGMAARKK